MTEVRQTLIKGGNVLLFDSDQKTSFPVLDVLVEGNKIVKIAENIEAPAGADVVDATGKIVTPGFVDGHRHVFQSLLRSTVSNHSLVDYFAHLLQGRMTFLDADDMYLSQVAGLAEAVSGGVTTVMDHSHVVTTEERARRCIQATVESGIRSIYCVSPFANPVKLNPLTFPDMVAQHAAQVELFKKLSRETPLGGAANDGRLTLGLGFDTIHHNGIEVARDVMKHAMDHNLPVTMHDVRRCNLPSLDFVREHWGADQQLPALTLSHTCDPTPADIDYVKQRQIGIVTTTDSEMSMGHGHPAAFDFYRANYRRIGLGIDSPAICNSDMSALMRLTLHQARVRSNATYHARQKVPSVVAATTDEVLYMATLGSAAAVHRDKEIGSLEVGKLADLVLWRTDSPSMVGTVDFSGALVTHATPSDVDSVMVNGEWLKRRGQLLRIDWEELTTKLAENRKMMEARWADVDWDRNKRELQDAWYLNDLLD